MVWRVFEGVCGLFTRWGIVVGEGRSVEVGIMELERWMRGGYWVGRYGIHDTARAEVLGNLGAWIDAGFGYVLSLGVLVRMARL